ncbi:succinyl-diaminopimelate desuccinylase [Pendulispora albinea]|uniref:Succinyl-diaminopimelate desuccinylase n=1 Tax=Pendulispora albinea TaxID=2741071 RepID=A0ABZ2M2W2_9BACT
MILTSPFDVFSGSLDETLLWLCAIPSPIGEEDAICDAVQARLQKQELAAPIRRYGNSIVVPLTRFPPAEGTYRPHIALVGHLDTVRTENGPARIEGDRLYGAGAADMKSGLAVMIALAETSRALLPCNVTLVFYAREEGPFADNELGPVLEQDPELSSVDLAVCLEPSDNRLQLGCNGSLHATVTFEGRTAHSSRPWQGDNAIVKASPLLTSLARLAPVDHVLDGHTYREVITVTQARDGGRGRNVVPDSFALNLNYRFTPDIPLADAEARLRSIITGPAHEHGWEVDGEPRIEITDRSPAAPPNGNHPLIAKLIEAGVDAVEPKQAWTDVARFAVRGIPAVNFGPGENAQAHQKNESTSLALINDGFQIVKRWLFSL